MKLQRIHTGVWYENSIGREHSEDLAVDERIILERIWGKWGEKAWTGCIWLRIATSGGLLWTR